MANPTAFTVPWRNPGRGSPIICPMETYIRGIRKIKDQMVRFFIYSKCSFTGSVPSSRVFCFPEEVSFFPWTLAPYPAWTTASMIPCSWITASLNSTCMLLVRRFTLTSFTPSSLLTHFSTLEEQAEQVIPVTSNFSFIALPSYNIFPSMATSSSTFSSRSSSVLAPVTQLFR